MLIECGAEGKSCVPGYPACSRHSWTGGCALQPSLFLLDTAFKPPRLVLTRGRGGREPAACMLSGVSYASPLRGGSGHSTRLGDWTRK